MLWWIVIILLIVALLSTLPTYSYSRDWGYAPSGIVGFIVILLLILLIAGIL